MRVTCLQARYLSGVGDMNPGDVLDVSAELAAQLIAQGLVEKASKAEDKAASRAEVPDGGVASLS